MKRSFSRRDLGRVVRFALGPPRRGWEIAASIVGIAFFARGLWLGIGMESLPSALFSSFVLFSLLSFLAYQYLGEESIEIGAIEVKVKRRLFELPIPRTASYPLASVEARFVPAGEGRRFNRIVMRVAGQQTWIAYAIEQSQANEVIDAIAARRAGEAIPSTSSTA